MERYELKIVEMSDVVNEVDKIWRQLRSDVVLREDAEDAGIDLSEIGQMKRSDALRISTPSHGITGAELFDVTAVSAVTGLHVAIYDLWKRVILPRIQQRFGKDAVKKHVAAKENSAKSTRPRRKKSSATSQERDSKRSKKKSKFSAKKKSR